MPERGCAALFVLTLRIGTLAFLGCVALCGVVVGHRRHGGGLRKGQRDVPIEGGRVSCKAKDRSAGGLGPATPRLFVDVLADGSYAQSFYPDCDPAAAWRGGSMALDERLKIGRIDGTSGGAGEYPCSSIVWRTDMFLCQTNWQDDSYEIHAAIVSLATLSSLARASVTCFNPGAQFWHAPSPIRIPTRGDVFWLRTSFGAESAVAPRQLWVRRPCLAVAFDLAKAESVDILEAGEDGAVDCCVQCGDQAGCSSWLFAQGTCSMYAAVPPHLLSSGRGGVAGVMHSVAKLPPLVSQTPREPGTLLVSSSPESPGQSWAAIPRHDECWERALRAKLFVRLKGGAPWTDLGAWRAGLGVLKSLGTKFGSLLLEHARPSVLCDRIAMCHIGSAVARGLYAMASTTVDALASRGNITSTCSGSAKLPTNPLPVSSQMKSFAWRMLGIYNHNSIHDLVTTLRDVIGLNITFIGMSSEPKGGCKAYPGSCLKPMWPFLDANFETSSCERYGKSHLDRFRRVHTALLGDSLVQNVNTFLCVHPPIYCEYFMTIKKCAFSSRKAVDSESSSCNCLHSRAGR